MGCPSNSVKLKAVFTVPWKLQTSTREPTAQKMLSLWTAHALDLVGKEPCIVGSSPVLKKEKRRKKEKKEKKKKRKKNIISQMKLVHTILVKTNIK